MLSAWTLIMSAPAFTNSSMKKIRLGNHQVNVEGDVRNGSRRFNHQRSDGDVGDKAAIHGIEVNIVRSRIAQAAGSFLRLFHDYHRAFFDLCHRFSCYDRRFENNRSTALNGYAGSDGNGCDGRTLAVGPRRKGDV